MVVFVVVREAEKWRYAVRKAKTGWYAVRKGEGVSPSYLFEKSSDFISNFP